MQILKKKIEEATHLYKIQKFNEAKIKCEELIKKNPKIVFLYNLMGLILSATGNNEQSIEYFKTGIRLNPDDANIYNNLGTSYKYKKDYKKSESSYKKSISLNNNLPETYNNLGNLYIDIKKYDNAIDSFKSSININPNFIIAHYNLALLYKSLGNFSKARNKAEDIIRLNKNFCSAHRVYSQLKKYKSKDSHLVLMEDLHKRKHLDHSNQMELCFAIAKAYDDLKDFKKAFNYYTQANDLRRQKVSFFLKDEKEEFLEIKNSYNQLLLKKNSIIKNNNKKLIFIIGMPRSGTTLVEQIISSHSDVYGAGELNLFNNLIKKKFFINQKLSSKFMLRNIKTFVDIGNEYIYEINSISNNSKKITDKLPINFKWIGLIKLIFPNSIIIHCQRNPEDTCLSIYKNYFTNNELNYAYDFNELLNYYELYENLMKFWKIKLKNEIIDIKYENLVNNTENEIKMLIKNCGLQWEKNCLNFHKNDRVIKTASDTQVRNKIYTNSVSSWQKYEKYFKKRTR